MYGIKDPEIQFYNAVIANPYKPNGSNIRIAAKYDPTTTNTTILQDPSKYYMSIIRFTIPNSDVPIFNFLLKDESKSTTEGVYGIALEYKGTVISQNLQYIPLKTSTPVEYGVYHYERMLDFVNTALLTAYTALDLANPLPADAKAAPFMTYESSTGLLSLWAPTGYDSQTADPVKIWFNTYLWDMMNSFNLKSDNFPKTGSSSDNRDYQIMVESVSDNVFLAATNPITPWRSITPSALNWFQMEQEYNTLFLWNDIRGFRFLSTTIPSVEEYTPAVSSVNNTALNSTSSTTSAIKIITDMEIQATTDASARSIVSYLPTAQFRYIELTQSGGPLKPFAFEIYAVDKFGNTAPLSITVNQSITVKFMFVRKDVAESRLKSIIGGRY